MVLGHVCLGDWQSKDVDVVSVSGATSGICTAIGMRLREPDSPCLPFIYVH